jgi:glycosyltransferase involved in cell wall biosynthesis
MLVKFTVIIPTYNRGYIIWKTIKGIQEQIYPYWELLIIDDGSTDDTQKVVAEYQKDPRIKYVKLLHSGGQTARNEGLKRAKGSIIAFVDSDDYVYDNFLSAALEHFQKNPKKLFATSNYNRRLERFDKNYKLIDFIKSSCVQKPLVFLKDFYLRRVEPCGTGIFLKRAVVEAGIKWDTKIKIFQDWDFILQLGKKYPDGYMHIPLVLFEYCRRFGIDGITSKATYLDWAKGFEAIYQKHKDDPLMIGQTWYPDQVNKYRILQKKPYPKKASSPMAEYFLPKND